MRTSGQHGSIELEFGSVAMESILLRAGDTWQRFPPYEVKEWAFHFEESHRQKHIIEALKEASELENNFARTYSLIALLPYLDETDRYSALKQTLTMMLDKPDFSWSFAFELRPRALMELAIHLKPYPDLLTQALTILQDLRSAQDTHVEVPQELHDQGRVFRTLAPCLALYPDLLSQALNIARNLPEYQEGQYGEIQFSPPLEALIALAPFLEEAERYATLTLTLPLVSALPAVPGSHGESAPQVDSLAMLTPFLTPYPDLLAQALVLVLNLPWQSKGRFDSPYYSRIEALVALAPGVSSHTNLLTQLLAVLEDIDNLSEYVYALARLAPLLATYPDFRDKALNVVRTLNTLFILIERQDQLISHFALPRDSRELWSALADQHRQVRLINTLQNRYASESHILNLIVAKALESLLDRGEIAATSMLLPLVSDPEPNVLPILERWLQHADPTVVHHAALLLAEAGHLSPQTLPNLITFLIGDEDRSRYRTMVALCHRPYNRPYCVSHIGRESVEGLAGAYLEYHNDPQIGTILSWSMNAIQHDDPFAIKQWINALERKNSKANEASIILRHIHHLSPKVWATLRENIPRAIPSVQMSLLGDIPWLLQNMGYKLEGIGTLLYQMVQSDVEEVRLLAVKAMGYLKNPVSKDLEVLKKALLDSTEVAQASVIALGHLAGGTFDKEMLASIDKLLSSHLSGSPIIAKATAGALVRIWLKEIRGQPLYYIGSTQGHARQRAKDLLDRLASALRVGLEDKSNTNLLLSALLDAGTDDDPWDDYHQQVVEAACTLLEIHPFLLATLQDQLENTLEAEHWPRRRIVLAAVAAIAERLPATFARSADPLHMEHLLTRAMGDADSFNVRRFALTALSHLRKVTMEVSRGLQTALCDVGEVQLDALVAAMRFRRVDGDLVPSLVEGLYNESATVAYATARLLAALGRSENIEVGQGNGILSALAEAVRDNRSHREVYVLGESKKIEHKGNLQQAIYNAMLQVMGVISMDAS